MANRFAGSVVENIATPTAKISIETDTTASFLEETSPHQSRTVAKLPAFFHGDLKPENILLFNRGKSQAILQIADLGLAAFHEEAHTNMRKPSGVGTGTSRYKPPEMGTHRETMQSRGRAYDIWSIGCILLEYLVWSTSGYDALRTFKTHTDFFWAQTNTTSRMDRLPVAVYTRDGNLAVAGQRDEVHNQPRIAKRKSEPPEDSPMSLIVPKIQFDSGSDTSMAAENSEQSKSLDDLWTSTSDNTFALQFLNKVGWDRLKPAKPEGALSLCSSCRAITTTRLFEQACDLYVIQERSDFCELCSLLLHAVRQTGLRLPRWVALRQSDGNIGIKGGPNLLSLYSEPGEASTKTHRLLITDLSHNQAWLADKEPNWVCRNSCVQVAPSTMNGYVFHYAHAPLGCQRVAHYRVNGYLPCRYVALSHCWGKLKETEMFCTTKANIGALKQHISLEELPRNFRDAVAVTRGLGVQYLWIDSICIIQDEESDWYLECARMERVFSNAYCTIGASASRSSIQGFLGDRPHRRCIQLQTPDQGTLYVCTAIDDFHRDVEQAPLSLRGWVLQERALSRRSIFFASTQVYWECGTTVYCETLTKLQNIKARFIGDANFPKFGMEYYRDGRQLLVQDLYERYSGLNITMPTDRAIAILGLQERLANAFRTQAAYGLFAVYFARGLLWRRASSESMTRISWPSNHYVPSWSWISKLGPIKYLLLEFEKVDWHLGDGFENPLKQLGKRRGVSGDDPYARLRTDEAVVLRGLLRKLLTLAGDQIHITFDMENDYDPERLYCMVVGRDRPGTYEDNAKYYVLVVYPTDGSGNGSYERVGVAALREFHLGVEASWADIK
ncbi:uncharacterized protein PG998_014957 [Apiospora kogelbergensis]|uniref:uncharacterized protein n=1 Tax=Apiospora kogelbergensis TaxID=1337665 RepID=UPI00312F7F33